MRDPAQQTLPNQGFAELMTAVLAKGKPFRFQASGASMSPFIRSGDILTLAAVEGKIRCGDVLAFRQPQSGRLAVHRVVACRKGSFLLKGDNGCQPDGWVAPENVIGRVIRVEHRGRQVRIGLGLEGILIAAWSRLGLLRPLSRAVRRLLRPVYKRFCA